MAVQKAINGKLVLSETQIDKAVQRIIEKKKRSTCPLLRIGSMV